MEDEALIDKDWITVENYQFKILVMVAVLAENHLAYRGKLSDMCNFLGVSAQTKNKEKIKEAIQKLEENGDVKVIKEGYTWTITLSVKAERKSKIITLRKKWIKLIQNYKTEDKNESVAWENILKVLVYLCADNKEIRTYQEIADDLNVSSSIVKYSIKALDNIKFRDIELCREIKYFKNNDKFYAKGQEMKVMLKFE